jgi:hypothetical protein
MVMKQRRKNTPESRVLGAIMIIKVVEHKDPQLLLIQVEQKGTKMTRELERKLRIHRRFQSVDPIDI